jgi:hypothetical protein
MTRPGLPVALVALLALAGCAAPEYGAGDGTDGPTSDTLHSAAPAITFRADEDLNRWFVSSAAADADWERYEARVTACETNAAGLRPVVGAGGAPYVNEASASGSGGQLAAASNATRCGAPLAVAFSDDPRPVRMNDYVEFCAEAAPRSTLAPEDLMTSVEVELRDRAAHSRVFVYLFAEVSACG